MIPGHSKYYASSDGSILSIIQTRPRIMKPIRSDSGHLYVFMYDNENRQKVWVHRAVLSAFQEQDEPNFLCRHLDDNPENNNLSNLAWGTYKQNTADRKKNKGLPYGSLSPSAKLDADSVMEIRRKYADGESSTTLAKEYGVSKNAILEAVRGDTWSFLPLVEITTKHSSARKTPISAEQLAKLREVGRKYADSIKIPRLYVECACGCGSLIETPDSKGRKRKYIRGHNSKGRHWKWGNNTYGEEDKNTIL